MEKLSVIMKITCSDVEYKLGQSDFARLRRTVAYSANKDFGSLYSELTGSRFHSDLFYTNFDIKVKRLIEAKKLSLAVARFCMMNDVNGRLFPAECIEIYNAILQTNLNEKYGSVFSEDTLSFERFKELLFECGKQKANLLWE